MISMNQDVGLSARMMAQVGILGRGRSPGAAPTDTSLSRSCLVLEYPDRVLTRHMFGLANTTLKLYNTGSTESAPSVCYFVI